MAKAPFKYNIKQKCDALPRSISVDSLLKKLKQAGIAERTFYRDKSIKVISPDDIPVERLMIYAKVFNCDITDLINYKVKAKPIVKADRINSPLS